jgi:Ca-activated chloride channel family protein
MTDVDPSIRVQVRSGGEKNFALNAITYRGNIDGPIGRFTLQQHFTNLSQDPLEIVYTFPLNSNMLIDEFHILLNGRSVHSQILPLDEAQKKYDDGVIKGDSAIYIQQHRSNIFTLNIGNLAPEDNLVIQLKLIQMLSVEGRVIRILLPTVVGPRYIPGRQTSFRSGFGWAEPTDRVPDADWITPPVTTNGMPYPVNFEIEVSKNLPVESAESPSHPIRFFPSDEGFKITSVGRVAPDRDFILNLTLKHLPIDLLWQTEFDSQKIFLSWLGISRSRKTEHKDTDYFFLIDRSGSMAHAKLKAVKKAIRLCLRKLTWNDRFNLAVFDHSFMFWKNDWQEAGSRNTEEAELWLKTVNANGGTELLFPLQKFFSMEFDPERRVVLVLLTDGEIGNEKEITKLFSHAPANLIVLLFGIDTAVNQDLFNSITEKVPGTTEYIFPGEPIEQKINIQFERLDFPLFKNVTINGRGIKIFPDNSTLQHSADLKPVLLLTEGEVENPLTLSIQLSDGTEHTTTPTVINCNDKLSKALKKFYAHFLIKKELRKLNVGTAHMTNPRHEKRVKEKLLKLAMAYQLQTELTAWYAYMEREHKIEDLPEIQIVPSAFPATWDFDSVFSPLIIQPKAKRKYSKRHIENNFSDDYFALNELDSENNFSDDYFALNELDSEIEIPMTIRALIIERSNELANRLLLTQDADGSLFPARLNVKRKIRATLLTLLAVLNNFGKNQKEARTYRSDLFRALEYILNHGNELSREDKIILYYIGRRFDALNLHLQKSLKGKFNYIVGKLPSYNYKGTSGRHFGKLKEIKLKGDTRKYWKQFVESVDRLFDVQKTS